jgi:hypothetical protein
VIEVRHLRLPFIMLVAVPLLAAALAAEELRAVASVDRRAVGVGETLTLTITVYGADKVEEPDLGGLEGFQVVNTYRSHNFSMVNMKVSRSLVLQYVLAALKEGQYTLGPFTVKSGKEAYEADAVEVAVSKGRVGRSEQGLSDEIGEDLVLLSATVDKKRAYVGEQITYTLKFAYRVRLDDIQYIPPEHTGFWYEDMGQTGPAIETIDGRRYYVVTMRTAFFPISRGSYTIAEAAVRYVVEGRDPFSRDPFSLFGRDPFGAFRREQGIAKTEPVTVEALALPREGRPSDFGGAVGRFSLAVVPSARELKTGESLTLSVKLKGRGNLKAIGDIPVPEIEGFRLFAPKARETMNVDGLLVGGEKIFDLVLVPQQPGQYVLDGLSFSYFDPDSERYATAEADPVTVNVLPGGDVPAEGLAAVAGDRTVGRRDIRHIRRGTIIEDALTLRIGGLRGALIRYLPVVVAVVGVMIALYRRRTEVTGRAHARRAFKMLMRDLKEAKRLLSKDGSAAEASGIASRSMRKYMARRAGTGEAQVDETFIGSIESLTPQRRARISRLLADLDRVRFAPVSADPGEASRLIDEAHDILKDVDASWNG